MTTPKNPQAADSAAAPLSELVGRRLWLKSAMAAGAAVAGVAALAKAEAKEADPVAKGAGDLASDTTAGDKAAEYGLMVKIANIMGNVTLSGFADCIPAAHCSFSSSAHRTGTTKGGLAGVVADKEAASQGVPKLSVQRSDVSLEIRAGKWLAELQQASFNVAPIGDVVISQLGQAVDTNAKAAPTVIQKITLTNAIVTSVQQDWDTGDGPRSASISFSFDKILFEIGTKPADFVLRNITATAV